MSITIKINGGTPKHGKSLCHTCKNASIVKGQNLEELIICQANMFVPSKGRVTFRVAECSAYHPTNMPWLHEMEAMAWMIEARKRGPVGFSEGQAMEIIITPPDGKRDRDQPGNPSL